MVSDYPDWTELIQIIGSDIMVPIDLQGAYIMMPVDIQAQYITLDIDIVAQTVGNLSVNVAAQTIDKLEVDITAQTVGDITIDIENQSVGLWGEAGWAALQGNDKGFRASTANAARGDDATVEYTVPAGKTLYLITFGGASYAVDAADADKQHAVEGYIYNDTTSTYLAHIGGNLGFGISFGIPLVVPENELVKVRLFNRASFNCNIRVRALGFEI